MSAFELRAHHGLCIRFFQGHGYSEAFTKAMWELIGALAADDPEVTLLTHCDGLCAVCPHRQGSLCDSSDKVEGYDRAVLAACGLKPGDTLPWSALSRRIDERILNPGQRCGICGDCSWNSLCSGTPPLRQ